MPSTQVSICSEANVLTQHCSFKLWVSVSMLSQHAVKAERLHGMFLQGHHLLEWLEVLCRRFHGSSGPLSRA